MTEKRASDSGKCGCDGGSAERAPTRRRFLVTLSALFGALAFGPRAHADPPHAHCAKVWWTLEDQRCSAGRVVQMWYVRCSVCSYRCRTEYRDVGAC